MSEIADHVAPNALMLFNESFAATNEREGSAIAREITGALAEKGIKLFFVTHLHDFSRGLHARRTSRVLFLRAERRPDGERTFRLTEGEPLETGHGEDLYRAIFERATGSGITDKAAAGVLSREVDGRAAAGLVAAARACGGSGHRRPAKPPSDLSPGHHAHRIPSSGAVLLGRFGAVLLPGGEHLVRVSVEQGFAAG